MDPLKLINTRHTVQTDSAAPEQVVNNAGGYVFEVAGADRVRRFLTLGTEGTYYTSAKDLTLDNAKVILDWAAHRTTELVDLVVQVSTEFRAPRNNPAILALAAAAGTGDDAGRAYALAQLPRVCRTGTHLFLFAGYVEQFRGWGRGLRRAVADWYNDKDVETLAYQMLKYRQREGWSHRDLLRLSHPKASGARNALYSYATGKAPGPEIPKLVSVYEAAKEMWENPAWLDEVITDYPLSWEMLPTEALNRPGAWAALILKGLPQTALIRQLPRLTRLGLFDDPMIRDKVVADLTDPDRLRRIHPVNILIAQRTYQSGQSTRGDGVWTPSRYIIDALNDAYYAAFGTVTPAGKRTCIGLDVSGSMGCMIGGLPITAREASVALSMVQLATEPSADLVAFTSDRGVYGQTGLTQLNGLSPKQRLTDVCNFMSGIPFGRTDCALPMLWAAEAGRKYDTFVIYTDNETYAGTVHPFQALRQYREKSGIPAKLIVVGMTATNFTIADPSDPGMLDVAGFDSAIPNLISDFSRGI